MVDCGCFAGLLDFAKYPRLAIHAASTSLIFLTNWVLPGIG